MSVEFRERLTMRAFRRVCLRLIQRMTAPKEAKRQRIGSKRTGLVRVCDMSDGRLLNTIFLFRRQVDYETTESYYDGNNYGPIWSDAFVDYAKPLAILEREAKRRRLPCKVKPKWLIERNRAWAEKTKHGARP